MHVHTTTCTHIRPHARMHAHMTTCTHERMHAHTHTHTRPRAHTHTMIMLEMKAGGHIYESEEAVYSTCLVRENTDPEHARTH